METFTKKVIAIMKSIPEGKVITYGVLAGLAGNKKAARHVSKILQQYSQEYNLPWHRVINSQGKISLKNEAYQRQKNKLIVEGIRFDSQDKINLDIYMWDPLVDL